MKTRAQSYLDFLETLELPTVGRASQRYCELVFKDLGLPQGVYPEGTWGHRDDGGRSCILMIEDLAALERLVREQGGLTEDDWNMVNATLLMETVG